MEDTADKFFTKIEETFTKLVTEFESKPIMTTIKGIVILYILKKGLQWWKRN